MKVFRYIYNEDEPEEYCYLIPEDSPVVAEMELYSTGPESYEIPRHVHEKLIKANIDIFRASPGTVIELGDFMGAVYDA